MGKTSVWGPHFLGNGVGEPKLTEEVPKLFFLFPSSSSPHTSDKVTVLIDAPGEEGGGWAMLSRL